jgi:hypothetical protein
MRTLTANDIITDAMVEAKVIAVGEAVPGAEIEQLLRKLNRLLDLWATQRLTFPVRTEDIKTLVAGQGSYTIGESGTPDISTVRPVKVEIAYLRDGDNDFSLEVDMTEAEYAALPTKTLQSLPTRLFYRPTVPNGTIVFDYLPDKAYSAHFFSQKTLTSFADLFTPYDFQPGYEATLVASMAVLCAAAYLDTGVPDSLLAAANTALSGIKGLNAEPANASFALVPTAGSGRRPNIYTLE